MSCADLEGNDLELWDIYNRDRIKTGDIMVRGDPFPEGAYHLVIHVCIFNSNGEMLIQQRQPFKEGWSNLWDITVGGSATAGDSSQSAAERELLEELGYVIDLSEARPHLTVNYEYGFDDYYLIEAEVDIDSLQLQHEEVQRVKWATKDEIFQMLDSGEFIPYYEDLIGLLFETRRKLGAHSR